MDGKHSYEPHEYPYDEFRMWRLCTMLRCKPSELEDESAVKLDWLIEIDGTVATYKEEARRKAYG